MFHFFPVINGHKFGPAISVNRLNLIFFFILLGIISHSNPGLAQGNSEEFVPGFSGYIQPMAGAGSITSLSRVTDSNRQITSFDQDAESETEFIPILLFKAGYTFQNGATRLYAGTPRENILEGNFIFEAGIRQKTSNETILTAAWIPEIPALDNEVWEDPFLLNSARRETDRDSQAFRISAENISGKGITMKYGFGRQKIENEQSGAYLAGQPGSSLTSQDLADLKRSGDFHVFEVFTMIPASRKFMIRPGLSYKRGHTDGDAMRFHHAGGQLGLLYMKSKFECNLNLKLGWRPYDSAHPIFEETREDLSYGATFGINYLQPFDLEDMKISFFSLVSQTASNIDFYDNQSLIGALGITWVF